MKIALAHIERLAFLARVTDKECRHLLDTDGRLFGNLFTLEDAQKIETDPILAERLDAFVTRFDRLQDTVGDKLIPALLNALAEKTGALRNGHAFVPALVATARRCTAEAQRLLTTQ